MKLFYNYQNYNNLPNNASVCCVSENNIFTVGHWTKFCTIWVFFTTTPKILFFQNRVFFVFCLKSVEIYNKYWLCICIMKGLKNIHVHVWNLFHCLKTVDLLEVQTLILTPHRFSVWDHPYHVNLYKMT
jgi:hypothetical protein